MWQEVDINYWSLTLIRRDKALQGQEVDVNELHLSCNKLYRCMHALLSLLLFQAYCNVLVYKFIFF